MKKTDTKRTSITPLTEAQRELVENNMRLVDYTIKTYFPASIRANSSWYLEYQPSQAWLRHRQDRQERARGHGGRQ